MGIVWVTENGSYSKEWIGGLHPCTEEDYAKFYKPNVGSKKNFEYYKEKKAWMCVDSFDKNGKPWDANLYGITGLDARSLDINFIPCIPK